MTDGKRQDKEGKIFEDVEGHERPGMRIDDDNGHVDVDSKGGIEDKSRQNVWS